MIYLKGFLIGAAMLIPGLSGGSAAMLLGIYDKIIICSANLLKDFKNSACFLFKITVGGAAALLLFTQFLLPHIDTNSSFIKAAAKIITAVTVPVFLKSSKVNFKNKSNIYVIITISGVCFFIYIINKLTGGINLDLARSPMTVFIGGMLLAAALVLPGISFSYMLLFLGLYEKSLVSLIDFNIGFLLPLTLGIAFGTVLCVCIFKELLKTYKQQFSCGIATFLLFSLF